MTANNNISPCEVCNDLLDIRNHLDMANAAAMAMYELFFERIYSDGINADHRRKRHEHMASMFCVLRDQIFNALQVIDEVKKRSSS